MSRYISVHFPWTLSESEEKDLAAIKARISRHFPTWLTVLDIPGVLVLVAPQATVGETHRSVPEKAGIVLGPIFRSTHNLRDTRNCSEFTLGESQAITHTRGRHLVSAFWGSYVAILSNPLSRGTLVIRSPLSRLKCFRSNYHAFQLFFSNIDDYVSLDLSPLSINWDCIAAQAASTDYLGRETAIKEIESVETGECVAISDTGVSRTFYWNPCNISKETITTDLHEAARMINHTTRLCVQSWASLYGKILHRVSGGLDSSISASCAREVLPAEALPGVNFYSHSYSGDERFFAREAAAHLGIDLTEVERRDDVDLAVFDRCTRTAWPVLDFSGYGQYQSELNLAKGLGSKAIFCGELGDNLFENEASRDAAKDYVWRHGFRPGILPVAIANASRVDLSVWEILYSSIRDRLRTDNSEHWTSVRVIERTHRLRMSEIALLRGDAFKSVLRNAPRFSHPWLESADGAPPAKFRMMCGLWLLSGYSPPFAAADDPPVVAPLASQPLVELSLKLPTYLANADAIDRSIARRAFADLLPTSIIRRVSKGGPEPWTREVLRRNQLFFRDYLADGILVSKGILDRARVESLLSNHVVASRSYIGDLIQSLYIEAWLRSWSKTTVQMAA